MLTKNIRQFTGLLCSALYVVSFTVPAVAQDFHFGLKAGVPMTEYFQTGSFFYPHSGNIEYSAATRRYTVGLSAEWRLKHGMGFEVGAQYKRMGYVHDEEFASYTTGVTGTRVFDVKGDSWDFPIMMKYRFGRSRPPYVSGGYVLRHIGPVRARGVSTENYPPPEIHTVTTQIDTAQPYDLENRNFSGLTVGCGIEFGSGRLRLLPELRFTRWLTNITTSGDALRLNPNQAEFLLGFLFLQR